MIERRKHQAPGTPARRSSDWAWLAGVADGEGSLRLVRGSCPQLEVTNTDRRILYRCRDIAGLGEIRQIRHHQRTRDCYRWTVSGDEARRILALLRPYLLAKADQADILLEHVKLAPGRRLTEEQRAWRSWADRKLRELKRLRHGPPGPPSHG